MWLLLCLQLECDFSFQLYLMILILTCQGLFVGYKQLLISWLEPNVTVNHWLIHWWIMMGAILLHTACLNKMKDNLYFSVVPGPVAKHCRALNQSRFLQLTEIWQFWHFGIVLTSRGFQNVSANNKVASNENWTHNTDHNWFRNLMLIQLC